nr:subtilisin-like protease SBT4.3 [Tanacetum cinerariifolium]
MGFPRRIDRRRAVESDVIMGIFDTGIWPESESFHDKGFGPVPKKWKGECAGGLNFTCNKKVIGARFYSVSGKSFSARDKQGHGTHVASIAAGNEVKHASYFDLAQGTARGGVPSARIAAYKVCEDSYTQHEPTSDVVALGALHAIKRGILTVSCAGNSGPKRFSVSNDAPWLLTVAASHIDRRFSDKVLLGDGSVVAGTSINSFPWSEGKVPIVYGKEVTKNCSEADARVKTAGALGCIAPDLGNNVSGITTFPTAALSANDFNLIKKYKTSTRNPKAKILKSEAIRNSDAPFVASDSSRGPSIYFPDLIKTKLQAATRVLSWKSDLNIPVESLNVIVRDIKSMLPKDNKLVENFYEAKKCLKEISLLIKKIHACKKHCMLFYEADASLIHCRWCGTSRYKSGGRKVPNLVLTYMPIADRLQMLYMSEKTTK